MGSALPGNQHGGPLVDTGKGLAYKLPGTASSYASIKTFPKDKREISVLLKIDHTTAVAYINNHGGTVSKELVSLTREIWMWCLKRNSHIQAQHLPGVLNHSANTASRSMKNQSDWKLDRQTFVSINKLYEPLEVDLFPSRLTNQCRRYFSWQPNLFA